jgi:hypothetical protein
VVLCEESDLSDSCLDRLYIHLLGMFLLRSRGNLVDTKSFRSIHNTELYKHMFVARAKTLSVREMPM